MRSLYKLFSPVLCKAGMHVWVSDGAMNRICRCGKKQRLSLKRGSLNFIRWIDVA